MKISTTRGKLFRVDGVQSLRGFHFSTPVEAAYHAKVHAVMKLLSERRIGQGSSLIAIAEAVVHAGPFIADILTTDLLKQHSGADLQKVIDEHRETKEG